MQGISLNGLGYYFDGLPARDRDSTADPTETSRYGGATSMQIGIAGRAVMRPEFAEILRGRGALADRGVSVGRVRHAFIDIVFTCPKSVSLLFGIGSPEQRARVVEAHVAARDSALGYLERVGAWVKLPTGSRRLARADGFIWAPFVHHVSRSGDPHLHSHVVVANLVASVERGWSALDSGPLFAERASAGQLYRAALRFELSERLGLDFRARSSAGSDVMGFSDHVLDAFSLRQRAINAVPDAASRSPWRDSSARRAATPKKEPEASIDDLHHEWNSRALRLGVLVDRDLAPERSRAVSGKRHVSALSSRVQVVVERAVSRFEAPFTRTQLITEVGTDLPFGAPIELIENQVGAVLSSLEEATDGEFPARGRASPLHDRRHAVHYLNAAVARAVAVEAGLFAEALSESDLVGLGTKATAWPRKFALALISTATAPPSAYATLRSLRQAAFEHARPLRLISSSTSSRSAFEAATGAEVPSLRLKSGRMTPAMTIVIDAWRLSVLERQRICDSATERGDLVVLCDSKTDPDFRSTERLRSSYSPLPPTRTTRRYEISDVAEVVVVDSLAEALVELGNLGTHYGESSRMLIDTRLRPFISGASIPDDQVRGATRGAFVGIKRGGALGARWCGNDSPSRSWVSQSSRRGGPSRGTRRRRACARLRDGGLDAGASARSIAVEGRVRSNGLGLDRSSRS